MGTFYLADILFLVTFVFLFYRVLQKNIRIQREHINSVYNIYYYAPQWAKWNVNTTVRGDDVCRDGGFSLARPPFRSLFQSVYRPRNLIKPRLPSGTWRRTRERSLAKLNVQRPQGTFTRPTPIRFLRALAQRIIF